MSKKNPDDIRSATFRIPSGLARWLAWQASTEHRSQASILLESLELYHQAVSMSDTPVVEYQYID